MVHRSTEVESWQRPPLQCDHPLYDFFFRITLRGCGLGPEKASKLPILPVERVH